MTAGFSTSKVRRPWEYPNQPPLNINASPGGGAVVNLIPASSPGLKIYLHGILIDIDPAGNTGVIVKVQEINTVPVATDLISIRQGQAGAPVNQYLPAGHMIPLFGVGLDSNNGIQLLNTAAGIIGVFGVLLWSKQIF